MSPPSFIFCLKTLTKKLAYAIICIGHLEIGTRQIDVLRNLARVIRNEREAPHVRTAAYGAMKNVYDGRESPASQEKENRICHARNCRDRFRLGGSDRCSWRSVARQTNRRVAHLYLWFRFEVAVDSGWPILCGTQRVGLLTFSFRFCFLALPQPKPCSQRR